MREEEEEAEEYEVFSISKNQNFYVCGDVFFLKISIFIIVLLILNIIIKHKMQLILNLIPWKRLTLIAFRNLWVRKIQRKKVLKTITNICMLFYCKKKLHTKVLGEEKTNCHWINLKSRESLFYPSKDLLEEVEKYEKIFQKYMESLWREDTILSRK